MHYIKTAAATVLCGLCAAMALTAPAEQPKVQQPIASDQHPTSVGTIATFLEVESKQALLAQSVPGIRINTWQGHSSIYGKPFSHGENPVASAENFRMNTLPMLGMNPEAVQPYANFLPPGQNTVPLMYNRETGTYKFTAVYYTQVHDGLEVYGTRMSALVKNSPGHPIVLANLQLRDLGNFQVDQAHMRQFSPDAAIAFARNVIGNDMQLHSAPRLVIWAGIDAMQEPARVAYEFDADGGDYINGTYQAYRFIADAATGTILHKESLIHHVDVTGNVSGLATDGVQADVCHGVAQVPLPYARVSIGGTFVYTDVNGNYTLPNAGSSDVTVQARLNGKYFNVTNMGSGGTTVLSQTVTPPGPANFVFNDPNVPGDSGQYKRAEVNAYLHANILRDIVLTSNPSYPAIINEVDAQSFPANVNLSQTCNAFYSSLNQSINFYNAGSGCTNTANSTVVYHEYGHRLVNAAGSGQGAYGEGMGDCMAVIVTDQPCLGGGFDSPCGTCLRNANNNCMWISGGSCNSTCGSASHTCGQVLSGCVWETRNNLAATNPATYLQIIRDLTINSVLLHTGSTVNSQITVHFLTLDDDDGDLENGTPHYHEINNGFTAHNLPGPPLNGFTIQATPNNQDVCAPAEASYTINIGQVGAVTGDVMLSVSGAPAGASVTIVPNPVSIPGSATVTIGNTSNATPGTANMTITGTMAPYLHTTSASVYISTAAPTTPVLTSPANGSIGVPVKPTLTWEASPQAQSYLVQVASDAAFANIVYSANTSSNSHLMGSALSTLTQYFWRVQASNPCGTTAFSSTFSFRTMDVPPILLVDDDDNAPNVRTFYTAALDDLGLVYDVWDVGNNTLPEPTYQDLLPYRVIIWFSGDAFGGMSNPKAGPKAATEAAIQQWLSEGRGCFFLSSQDYLWDRIGSSSTTPNSFMQNYLGMGAPIDHDEGYTAINPGLNVFAGYGPWTLAFSSASGGPGMSNFSDRVPPSANGLQSFTYGPSAFGSAVTIDGGVFRSAFFAHPIEAIPNASNRSAVLSRLLGWCGELFPPPTPCTGDVDGDSLVNVADLLAVINAWGPCPACAADVNQDGQVNVTDLLAVINGWGACE